LKINVQNIPPEGLTISFAEHPIVLTNETLSVNGPIEGTIFAQKLGEVDVHIRGSLSARIVLACRRCLNTFEHLLESEFYIDCTHEVEVTVSGQEHCLYGEELNLHFYKGELLDIDEVIESQINLEVPMAPLCKEDCLGLCPTCGEDLNVGPCGCNK